MVHEQGWRCSAHTEFALLGLDGASAFRVISSSEDICTKRVTLGDLVARKQRLANACVSQSTLGVRAFLVSGALYSSKLAQCT